MTLAFSTGGACALAVGLSLSLGCSSSSSSLPLEDGGANADGGGAGDAGSDAHDAGREASQVGLDGTTPNDSGGHDGSMGDDGGDAADAKDAAAEAGPDAGASGSFASLTGCLGTTRALTISGQMPYVDVPVGSEAGEFVLDFGSTFSSIDLSAFASPGPTTTGCDSSELGVKCTVEGFAFFAAASSVSLETEDFSDVGGSVTQAGIIGTDFLSEKVFALDYAGGHAYAAASGAACSDSALTAAGFVALSAAGFFENDESLLEPFTDVDDQASAGDSVPNVPTVPVQIAGAAAVAQLDTGFDDDVTPFSVNINKAFYNAVVAANSSALVRDSSLDESLTTCVEGVSEPVKGYRLASGTTFDFVGAGSVAARSYAQAVIFVKETPASAQSCGGIGTWSAAAAQVAASFYVDMKTIVLDPFNAKVWVPKG